MKCPCCHTEKTGEYFHVLSTDIRDYKFNYCCSDCLAERLRVPRHIKFELTEKDKRDITEIAVQAFNTCFDIKKEEIRKIADKEIADFARKVIKPTVLEIARELEETREED